MNHQEAAQIVAMVAAVYRIQVTDDLLEMWHRASLERTEFDLGLEVVDRLVGSSERMPTPAMFNGVCGEVKRDRYAAEVAARRASEEGSMQLTGPGVETAAQQRARFLAMLRDVLAAAATRRHWHGGPDPCRVCGGINPRLRQ